IYAPPASPVGCARSGTNLEPSRGPTPGTRRANGVVGSGAWRARGAGRPAAAGSGAPGARRRAAAVLRRPGDADRGAPGPRGPEPAGVSRRRPDLSPGAPADNRPGGADPRPEPLGHRERPDRVLAPEGAARSLADRAAPASDPIPPLLLRARGGGSGVPRRLLRAPVRGPG